MSKFQWTGAILAGRVTLDEVSKNQLFYSDKVFWYSALYTMYNFKLSSFKSHVMETQAISLENIDDKDAKELFDHYYTNNKIKWDKDYFHEWLQYRRGVKEAKKSGFELVDWEPLHDEYENAFKEILRDGGSKQWTAMLSGKEAIDHTKLQTFQRNLKSADSAVMIPKFAKDLRIWKPIEISDRILTSLIENAYLPDVSDLTIQELGELKNEVGDLRPMRAELLNLSKKIEEAIQNGADQKKVDQLIESLVKTDVKKAFLLTGNKIDVGMNKILHKSAINTVKTLTFLGLGFLVPGLGWGQAVKSGLDTAGQIIDKEGISYEVPKIAYRMGKWFNKRKG